ncbi:glutamate--cysteine ligase [Candidatus Thiosymbion oneisti]|uniref:glutamate--cysteine ligase n=1 Tax=Candidatus Thiosymbion oneisti TaxID=589554 RepID=UPI000B2B40D2|nr:glutamate--cysteine ligase [Candidatus Thiosymbion oneisti]
MDPCTNYNRRLTGLARAPLGNCLQDGLIGLEKEGLRVSPAGTVAASPHPAVFGSALMHPYLTTDFSEALLETITPPMRDKQAVLAFLHGLHVFVHHHLGDELLWATSMPCVLEGADPIPLARYGTSNAARMKTVYRRGLGNRYGRPMQVIAGVHYNFSFSDAFWPLYRELEGCNTELGDFRSEAYMASIRNLQRFGWLIPYLFGASPAVCKTFVQNRNTDLEAFDRSTYFYPYATSLRMGDRGYQNLKAAGTGMQVNYDSLDAYLRSLAWAVRTPCPAYQAIGVKVGGRYQQLNANLLQIENEYYGPVRPKQPPRWMEKPSLALRQRGVGYLELRSLDVNAFHPLGVTEEQLYFLDAFMLFCLLTESPRIGTSERRAIDANLLSVAHRGRDPSLELDRNGNGIRLRQWAEEVLDAMLPAAELMDGGSGGPCANSLRRQQEKVRDPELTPSARMLAEMRANAESFFDFAQRTSQQYRDRFRSSSLDTEYETLFERLSRESWERQRELEETDDMGFDEFLERYFAQGEQALDFHP